jgi:2-succinyl-5-enolpyruvyl-6-hydroxy-3-cyclohexene-1-carboxylate synthase
MQYAFAGYPTTIPLTHQAIYNIAEICARHGATQVVLSPGSRCAPLTIAFARHPEIDTRTISDERSAAFIGLGMALVTNKPTVLVCTSGSAAYNYAPAVAEALFQQVPLVVITADRPPEWVDQLDGQTIRQSNIYGDHVKGSFNLPVDTAHPDAQWHINRIVNEALLLASSFPQGPVHLNVPLREPLYPKEGETVFYEEVRIVEEKPVLQGLNDEDWTALKAEWQQHEKKLIIGGQMPFSDATTQVLTRMVAQQKVPVVGDVISNLHRVTGAIYQPDLILQSAPNELKEHLRPDLLITFGKSVISKQIKSFLRSYKPKAHWHIQPEGYVPDTFQCLTRIIRCNPINLMKGLVQSLESADFSKQRQENFLNLWHIEQGKATRYVKEFFNEKGYSEAEAFYRVVNSLPSDVHVHLANSMAVRYADYFGMSGIQAEIFANRGTSGIDGSSSTAVGTALLSGKLTYLFTGDVAFFYDRNAWWHNYPMENIRIVLFNNHGGGIFRMIDGPGNQPELEEFFETRQMLTAKHLAAECDMEYILCDHARKLQNSIKAFMDETVKSGRPRLLEIITDSTTNKSVLDTFRKVK